MPYITQHRRALLAVRGARPTYPGDLNYTISRLIDHYLSHHGVAYMTLNEVIGVLECVKLELYRRVAAGYEDKKMAENGDVYTCQGTIK